MAVFRWMAGLAAIVVLVGCGGGDGSVRSGGGTWRQLDLAGFADRMNSFVVPFDDELLVFGGRPAFDCPDGADCTMANLRYDGRAFALDGSSGSRGLSDIPEIQWGEWTTTDEAVFFVGHCVSEQTNCSDDALARYTIASDRWELFDPPPQDSVKRSASGTFVSLVTIEQDVYFISEVGEPTQFGGDFRWHDDTETWERLETPDLGARNHRRGVEIDGELVIFTWSMDAGPGQAMAAHRYDEAIGTFVEWPIPPVQSCRRASARGVTYFFPSFESGSVPGGQYDEVLGEWGDLPPGPRGEPWNCGLVGVLETERPEVAGQLGWLYEQRADQWRLLDHPVLDRSDRAEKIFVYDNWVIAHGGSESSSGRFFGGSNTRYGGTWVWSPVE